MKSKKVTIDTFSITNNKLLVFYFNVSENLKRENIHATIKEYMADINPKYSIYTSPKLWDVDEIKTLKEIKEILVKTIKPVEPRD